MFVAAQLYGFLEFNFPNDLLHSQSIKLCNFKKRKKNANSNNIIAESSPVLKYTNPIKILSMRTHIYLKQVLYKYKVML